MSKQKYNKQYMYNRQSKGYQQNLYKQHLKENLNTVRAGRANPALLDKIMVDYYGMPTSLKSLANISVPDPRTLLIQPFDPKSISNIERAINESNIGINPSNDGKVIRLVIPQLTEERRKELVKQIKKMGEESKVAIRNLRREVNEDLKKAQKAGEITEDDMKSDLDDTQKKIDKAIKDIDNIIEKKNEELMEV